MLKCANRFVLVPVVVLAVALAHSCSGSSARESGAPERKEVAPGYWIEELEIAPGIRRVRQIRKGELRAESILAAGRISKTSYDHGVLFAKSRRCIYKPVGPEIPHDVATLSAYCGLFIRFHTTGSIRQALCYTPDKRRRESRKCGLELHFSPRGKVVKRIKHPATCEYGCGEFRPLLEPGRYRVVVPKLTVHEGPDKKYPGLFQLAAAQKIAVTKDTHKIVTISGETAPWVKIRTADGRDGFVFGGFIRGEKEPYVDMGRYVGE